MSVAILVPLIASLLLADGSGPAQPSPALTVSHRARQLQPGEAVVLVVSSGGPLKTVRATAFGRDIPLTQAESEGRWQGLFGIDLATKAGRYVVVVDAQGADGAAVSARHELTIRTRQFPTRRLSVDGAFVNPPAGARARIQAEAKAVEAVLARVSPGRWWPGPFARPVPGQATSGFGRRSVLNGEVRSIHAGVDFRAAAGTPVRAPAAGRVALAADHYFAGRLVIVDHGLGLFSFLAHLSSVSVTEGQEVGRGEVVGLSGATGRVTGPHLHWSVRLPGARVDPVSVMALFEVEPAAGGVVR